MFESLFKLVFGNELYTILMSQYPLFVAIISFLFLLMLFLIIFNFMSNITINMR